MPPRDKPLQPSTIRIGRRYRASRLDGPYDAIVIGSGIGGLTTAACLARLGKKVAVLEQHYTAGGFTHSYSRNGYEWDVGVHYIGDMGKPSTMGRKLLAHITDGSLEWAPMDADFDQIFLGEDHYTLRGGKAAYRERLIEQFPADQQAIETYLRYVKAVRDSLRLFTVEKILPGPAANALRKRREKKQPPFFNMTTRQVLEQLTDNQKLIAVITGQWGDNGLPPARSSFIIHCMIAQHYMNGGYYPVGGASRMAESIIPVIQSSGGDVYTYASVEQIVLEKGKAVGVTMADGNTIRAPLVISNAGVLNTFNKLLPQTSSHYQEYQQSLQTIEPSMASLCLYIGIQDTAENLGLPKSNFWIYPSEHYEEELAKQTDDPDSAMPLVYISFPSAKDPDFTRRYPGRATIEIVAPGPYAWFAQWADKPWGKRGDDYDALKEKLSQRLLEVLYTKLPQLRDKIDYYELSTPLSTDFFCRYSRGEIYGLNHDPERFEQSWLKPKTHIPGLYLTGQDVMTCGVVGAMVGGLLTAINTSGLKGLKLAKEMFVP
jgi:phytoene dehydrogenase-like protein